MQNISSLGPWRRRIVIRFGKVFLQKLGQFQARHSLISTGPFIDKGEFPWAGHLEQGTGAIRAELDRLLERPEDIPAFHVMSPDQYKISTGDSWKTFALRVFNKRITENCELCPDTARLLEQVPGLRNAWFSILAPGYRIPPHFGPTRAVVRCHLGLRVPADNDNCWIRVDREIRHWHEGECLFFDDTFEHEVRNDTDELRAVLFIDVDRPADFVGRTVNSILLRMIRLSTYVQTPLKNLAAWNRTRGIGP